MRFKKKKLPTNFWFTPHFASVIAHQYFILVTPKTTFKYGLSTKFVITAMQLSWWSLCIYICMMRMENSAKMYMRKVNVAYT